MLIIKLIHKLFNHFLELVAAIGCFLHLIRKLFTILLVLIMFSYHPIFLLKSTLSYSLLFQLYVSKGLGISLKPLQRITQLNKQTDID